MSSRYKVQLILHDFKNSSCNVLDTVFVDILAQDLDYESFLRISDNMNNLFGNSGVNEQFACYVEFTEYPE